MLEVKSKQAVQETYGNAAKVVDDKTAALLFGQSEKYVEYNAQVDIFSMLFFRLSCLLCGWQLGLPMLFLRLMCLLCACQLGKWLFLSAAGRNQLLGACNTCLSLLVRHSEVEIAVTSSSR